MRERREDIPLLLSHYAGIYSQKYNLPAKRFSAGLMDALSEYAWPGNVRALRHAVERAVILSDSHMFTEADFPFTHGEDTGEAPSSVSRLDEVEKAAVIRALERHDKNISRAAQALGLTLIRVQHTASGCLGSESFQTAACAREQISYQLGHKRLSGRGEARTTRNYGDFAPEYLAEASAVLAAWVAKVLDLADQYSHANSHNAHGKSRKTA